MIPKCIVDTQACCCRCRAPGDVQSKPALSPPHAVRANQHSCSPTWQPEQWRSSPLEGASRHNNHRRRRSPTLSTAPLAFSATSLLSSSPPALAAPVSASPITISAVAQQKVGRRTQAGGASPVRWLLQHSKSEPPAGSSNVSGKSGHQDRM